MKKYFWTILSVILVGIMAVGIAGFTNQRHLKAEQSPLGQRLTKKQFQKYPAYQVGQKFKFINLSVDQADITVQTGDKYQVQVQNNASKPIVVKKYQQNLVIRQWTQHHAHSIPAHSAKIVITVPNKAALKAVKLTLDSGNLVFKNLQLTQSSYAATDSGHIAMQNCDLQKIRLAFDTGKVSLDKCKLRHLTMACDEGDVKIKQSQLLGKSRIVSDDLQLSLQDVNKDLSYHFIGSDISGSYYGKDIDGDKHFSHYKNSKNSLHIVGDDLHLTVK